MENLTSDDPGGVTPPKSTGFFNLLVDITSMYQTPKVVNIRSKRIGAMYRLVQAAIIAYVIGYVFVWEKGYQETDRVESSVVTKVKGIIRTKPPYPLGLQIWDSVDFITPAQENNAFFIATNVLATPNQQQATCPEDKNVGIGGVRCASDEDCPPDTQIVNGNGFRTGTCSNVTGTCEILAWCPTEIDVRPVPPVLAGSENFTILVKNHIMFPKFGVKRRNILEDMNATYLANCRYHPVQHPYCPIFVLGDVLKLAGESYSSIAERGGVMGFVIEWNCNLDLSVNSCLPVYHFRRMDNKDDKLAKGWNFRYANYWADENHVERRTVVKAYGIRFVFNVYGKAGRFSPVVFAMNLGSGLGLLGIATILCDFVLLNCLKNRQTFQEFKFLRMESKYLRRDSGKRGSTSGAGESISDSESPRQHNPNNRRPSASPNQRYRPYSNNQVQTHIDDVTHSSPSLLLHPRSIVVMNGGPENGNGHIAYSESSSVQLTPHLWNIWKMSEASAEEPRNFAATVFTLLFSYPTPKVVNIRIKRIGLMYRLVQVAIISYVIGYVFIWKKGYQETDRVMSSVVTKVKGVVRADLSHPSLGGHIWDSVDLLVPSQENNAFFITTNLLVTPDQTQGNCPEDPNIDVGRVSCVTDSECVAGGAVTNGNGFRTGICRTEVGTCEVSAWCPTERDVRPKPPVLTGSENFTVLVKNHIMFPKFGVKRRNIPDDMNATYLASCRYHPTRDPFCPIFIIGDILRLAGETYDAISDRGGIVAFIIEWYCNLDVSESQCKPVYSFRRMDTTDEKIAKGWNFRFGHYWTDSTALIGGLFNWHT
ncbi:P2X purinoceptor 4, partial [Hypsibius exemplaris]